MAKKETWELLRILKGGEMNLRVLIAGAVIALLVLGHAFAQGGTLRVGISEEPWDLDPAIATDTASLDQLVQNIYDPLIELDQKNEPTSEFALCKGWELENNAQTLVLYLREGVKFHDGTDFTASDVKYNLEWQLDPENNAPYKGVIGPVESIEVVDDYTLKVYFEAPYPDAVYKYAGSVSLGGIVPEGSRGERSEEKGVAGVVGTELSRNPIGTGPFKFVEWVSGSHITLERNDNYWVDGVPAEGIEKAVFEFIKDSTAMEAALISGSVDIVDSVPFQDVKLLTSLPNINVSSLPGTTSEVIYINLSAPPFGISADEVDDEEAIDKAYNLRKFVFHAIDREEISDNVFYGMAVVQYGPWYADSDWTSPKVRDITLHDPELAQEYLAKAGYAEGGLNFRIMCTREGPFCDTRTIIQEQLRQYGVGVEVIPIDKAAFYDTLYETENWDLAAEDFSYTDLLAISQLYAGYYRNEHNHNHWHHASPDLPERFHASVPGHKELSDLYGQANIEPDEQKRKELVWTMQELDKLIWGWGIFLPE